MTTPTPEGQESAAPIQAHSKTEFKRLSAQGANVLPPPNVESAAPYELLRELLDAARNHVMTPLEIYEQRISWIYGQYGPDSIVTREEIEERLACLGYTRPDAALSAQGETNAATQESAKVDQQAAIDLPAVAAPHPETLRCGYDRNASHSAGHYVCACGWQETPTEAQAGVPREGCHYLADANSVCNKCGKIHYAPDALGVAQAGGGTPRPRAMLLSPVYMTISNAAEILDYAEKLETELAAAKRAADGWERDHTFVATELQKAEAALSALQRRFDSANGELPEEPSPHGRTVVQELDEWVEYAKTVRERHITLRAQLIAEIAKAKP